MFELIGRLLRTLWKAIIALAQFITILMLGLVVAILTALPWFLRITTILAWLIGGYYALQTIQDLYGPNSPAGPLLALQFTVIFLMTTWVGVLLLKSPTHLWGGLLCGGLFSIGLTRFLIPALFARWQLADLFFRILPPALFSMALLYLTLRLRWLRSTRNLKLVNPAFIWLPKAVHQAKETIQQRGHHE